MGLFNPKAEIEERERMRREEEEAVPLVVGMNEKYEEVKRQEPLRVLNQQLYQNRPASRRLLDNLDSDEEVKNNDSP